MELPRIRRQNHSNEILVRVEASEKVIWNSMRHLSVLGIQSSGTSQICRSQPYRASAREDTVLMAIAASYRSNKPVNT